MAQKRGSISLPKEMDPTQKSTQDQATTAKHITDRRLSSVKGRADGTANRLADILQRTGGSPLLDAGGPMWDVSEPAKDSSSPITPEKSRLKNWGPQVEQMPLHPDLLAELDSPSSPGLGKKGQSKHMSRLKNLREVDGLDTPTIVRYGSNRFAEGQNQLRQRSSLPENVRLGELQDTDGLDSPTIMRRGSRLFTESQSDATSSHYNGSSMRKTSSVPELKAVGGSTLASRRRFSANSSTAEEVLDKREKRASLLSGWRDEVVDVRTLMKVDGRTDPNSYNSKVYRTEDETPIDDGSPKGKLVNEKSYRKRKKKIASEELE